MTQSNTRYDVIIIGTGAGGGTVAHELANTGKRILVLERGEFLPREKENWDPENVYQDQRYYTDEEWCDRNGDTLNPQTCYWVGGNTKVYGAALLPLREKDFEAVEHEDGISPSWPLKYADFAPYYARAEKLFSVHGQKGQDPTEPERDDYPYPAVGHEPFMQSVVDGLEGLGYAPFNLPVGLRLNEVDKTLSDCIRCDTCDGFPCLVGGKADAEISCIRPVRAKDNITLITRANVLKLLTDASGGEVTGVETRIGNDRQIFSGDLVVVACGAINSAALLLRSANDAHPHGLANSSDQVGRNFMKHLSTTIVALSDRPNLSTYQKTIGLNDFYWGEPDFPYPMGMVQNTGNVKAGMIPAEAPPALAPLTKVAPGQALELTARHATGWWLQTEDLPAADTRVRWVKDRICLDYTENNLVARDRLVHRWTDVLKQVNKAIKQVIPIGIYPRSHVPLSAVGHQCGTCRFGADPATSVLDPNCRTHDINNLYVVDSSFFPSNSGVNPTLTIVANAIRVADHLKQRLAA
ncbi:MAG: GMC family oxidoreductase [Cyanobacteria bacterium P01_A01_bin.105]